MMRITPITKALIIANVALYLLTVVLSQPLGSFGPVDLTDLLGLHFFIAPDFYAYQLLTYMFMHGSLMHLFFNMFALWMFGSTVESVLGRNKFLFYYIVCGIGAGLFQECAQFVTYAVQGLAAYSTVNTGTEIIPMSQYLSLWTTVGASGSVYGLLLAFGMIFPEQRILIFPLPFPIKAKWFVVIYAAIELFMALSGANSQVAHIAHLGGMVVGFFLIRHWKRQQGYGYHQQRRSFFDNIRNSWQRRSQRRPTSSPTQSNPDWDYNAQQRQRQEEIDRILERIKRSGYDSLTKEEKQKLFDMSNRR